MPYTSGTPMKSTAVRCCSVRTLGCGASTVRRVQVTTTRSPTTTVEWTPPSRSTSTPRSPVASGGGANRTTRKPGTSGSSAYRSRSTNAWAAPSPSSAGAHSCAATLPPALRSGSQNHLSPAERTQTPVSRPRRYRCSTTGSSPESRPRHAGRTVRSSMGRPPVRPEPYPVVRSLRRSASRRPCPRILSGSRLGSLGDHDGAGETAVVGEREVQVSDAQLARPGRNGARHLQARPARLLADDVRVRPVQPAGCAERLRERLLGGETGGEAARRQAPLALGEQPRPQRRRPPQRRLEAGDVDEVDAQAEDHTSTRVSSAATTCSTRVAGLTNARRSTHSPCHRVGRQRKSPARACFFDQVR